MCRYRVQTDCFDLDHHWLRWNFGGLLLIFFTDVFIDLAEEVDEAPAKKKKKKAAAIADAAAQVAEAAGLEDVEVVIKKKKKKKVVAE